MNDVRDDEGNRLTGRVGRYARVGTSVGGVAARMAGARLFGGNDKDTEARLLKEALGGLKGPLMKVAQLMATIPDALPAEYARELAQLQVELCRHVDHHAERQRMLAEKRPLRDVDDEPDDPCDADTVVVRKSH